MIINLTDGEVELIQMAILRARTFTPNLPAADDQAMTTLLERLLDKQQPREPGDVADDAAGDVYLSEARLCALH